jgi:hypothetical protein
MDKLLQAKLIPTHPHFILRIAKRIDIIDDFRRGHGPVVSGIGDA